MIMLIDRHFKVVKTCRHEEEFCDYICYLKNQENKKAALDPDYPAVKWGFTRYPHKFLKAFLENRNEKAFQEAAEQAYGKQQDVLMIHKGGQTDPLYISVNSELDFVQLRKDWCQAFAKDQGLIVITP